VKALIFVSLLAGGLGLVYGYKIYAQRGDVTDAFMDGLTVACLVMFVSVVVLVTTHH
jgi:hypothetical protein